VECLEEVAESLDQRTGFVLKNIVVLRKKSVRDEFEGENLRALVTNMLRRG
jgi:hypothetical protein